MQVQWFSEFVPSPYEARSCWSLPRCHISYRTVPARTWRCETTWRCCSSSGWLQYRRQPFGLTWLGWSVVWLMGLVPGGQPEFPKSMAKFSPCRARWHTFLQKSSDPLLESWKWMRMGYPRSESYQSCLCMINLIKYLSLEILPWIKPLLALFYFFVQSWTLLDFLGLSWTILSLLNFSSNLQWTLDWVSLGIF